MLWFWAGLILGLLSLQVDSSALGQVPFFIEESQQTIRLEVPNVGSASLRYRRVPLRIESLRAELIEDSCGGASGSLMIHTPASWRYEFEWVWEDHSDPSRVSQPVEVWDGDGRLALPRLVFVRDREMGIWDFDVDQPHIQTLWQSMPSLDTQDLEDRRRTQRLVERQWLWEELFKKEHDRIGDYEDYPRDAEGKNIYYSLAPDLLLRDGRFLSQVFDDASPSELPSWWETNRTFRHLVESESEIGLNLHTMTRTGEVWEYFSHVSDTALTSADWGDNVFSPFYLEFLGGTPDWPPSIETWELQIEVENPETRETTLMPKASAYHVPMRTTDSGMIEVQVPQGFSSHPGGFRSLYLGDEILLRASNENGICRIVIQLSDSGRMLDSEGRTIYEYGLPNVYQIDEYVVRFEGYMELAKDYSQNRNSTLHIIYGSEGILERIGRSGRLRSIRGRWEVTRNRQPSAPLFTTEWENYSLGQDVVWEEVLRSANEAVILGSNREVR